MFYVNMFYVLYVFFVVFFKNMFYVFKSVQISSIFPRFVQKIKKKQLSCCHDHREEIYREETRGKLCHADIFSLLITNTSC